MAGPDQLAPEMLRVWREHPVQFVRDQFHVEPDAWQVEALEAFPHQPLIALQACKGPGKSAVLAWLGWNFMVTRPYPKCAATSISGDNLRDNLWTELAKWQSRSKLLQSMFTWTGTRITMNQAPETWFMSARSWSKSASTEDQANALAGLHADYILFLIDESGSIPPAIGVTAEAALSSCIEGHIVQAGNPTSHQGLLYFAVVKNRGRWFVVVITGDPDSPRRSPRISVEWARQQIASYGPTNPWVLINVLGEFPPSDLNALIGPADIEAAMLRVYKERDIANSPRLLGVDVAREGDDQSVMYPRQGLQLFRPRAWRNLDSIQGAGSVVRFWADFNADACFVDNTGGFGAGWIDQMRMLHRAPIGVGFANQAQDAARYYNKRTEMAFQAAEWVKHGGALPPGSNELMEEMVATTYAFKGDRLLLEPKDLFKSRIGHSPDHFDAFMLTFAEPVLKAQAILAPARFNAEYNPFERGLADAVKTSMTSDYDPVWGDRQ